MDLVKTALRGGAIGIANTPGEATVTKTLAKRSSVSFASYGLFSLPMSASVVPFVEIAAVREQHSSRAMKGFVQATLVGSLCSINAKFANDNR